MFQLVFLYDIGKMNLVSPICYDFIGKKYFAAIDAINVCNYLPLGLHRSGLLIAIHTTMWVA